jgi:GTP-binding protein
MFVDVATVKFRAGDGGDGVVSFRHEIYVDKGGPDGGDGGKGGDVILVASRNQNTLAAFRYSKELSADPGKSGSKRKQHGRSGKNLEVPVPVGTSVLDSEGKLLFDLVTDGQRAVVAKGGAGGFGNAHFTSSTRQTPRVAEKGEPGEEREVQLELKMIADVGLVGMPNAGKSTLLSVISNAKPEIANYAFTTLTPNLGVVDVDKDHSLLVADIPGLIEGAADGKGLGDEFLRHVERTAVILHLIDSYQNDLVDAYSVIQAELAAYKTDLTNRPQIVVLTKIEGLDQEIINDRIAELRAIVPNSTPVHAVSALSRHGILELLRAANKLVRAERARVAAETPSTDEKIPVLTLADDKAWSVEQTGRIWTVTGRKIEKFSARTDFENYHGTQRLRDIMRKMGIMHELERRGINPGEIIRTKYGDIEY